jgi:hypothetical protein
LCATWDPYFQQWIVGGGAGAAAGGAFVSYSPDGGKSWLALPGNITSAVAYAVATDPIEGSVVALCSDGTNTTVQFWPEGFESLTATTQPFLAGVDIGVCANWNGAFWFVGSTGFVSASWTGYSASSLGGLGVWTNESGTLPSGWAASGGANAIQQYATAQSPTTLAVAMCGANLTTSSSRLMYQTTSAGWLDVTPGFLGGSAQQITGICYDANDGLWGLLTQDTSNSYLYTAPDLVTWTLVQTFIGFASSGVNCIGSVFAVALYDSVAGAGFYPSGCRVAYSSNVATTGAGCTWSFAAYSEPATRITIAPGVTVGPVGMLLTNAGAQGGGIVNGLASQPNPVGSQLLRVSGSLVASSHVAGYMAQVAQASLLPTAPPGQSLIARFAFNSTATTFLGPNVIPAGAEVLSVKVDVRTGFSPGTTFAAGQAGAPTLLVATGTIDSSLVTPGIYTLPLDTDWGAAALQPLVTIGGSPSVGAGFVIIEFLAS